MQQLFLSIKYYEDDRNRTWVQALGRALQQRGVRLFCVASDLECWGTVHFSASDLMLKTFEQIRNSQVVLVEFSVKGVGIGIEAGYAFGKGIPVWVAIQGDGEVSETLRGIAEKIFRYRDLDDLVEQLDEFME